MISIGIEQLIADPPSSFTGKRLALLCNQASVTSSLEHVSDVMMSSEAELAADRLESAGASSVSFADAGDQPVLEPAPGETPLWPRIQVSALFPLATDPAHIDRSLNQPAPLNSRSGLCVTRLDDRDWEREWLRDFRPMRFGRRLWVCPSGREEPGGAAAPMKVKWNCYGGARTASFFFFSLLFWSYSSRGGFFFPPMIYYVDE